MRIVRYTFLIGLLFFFVPGMPVQANDRIVTELVRLKTADGITLDGVLRQPPAARSKPGIVMVHGYSGNFYSGIMAFLPDEMSRLGFATLAVNMRDHDRGPKNNRFEENRYDIAIAVDEMARRGYGPLFLYGHSMGTNRVLYYLSATRDSRISGAILTGPPGNLFQWNVRLFGNGAATRVLRQAQELTAAGKSNEWMLVDLGPLGKALYTANHLVSLRGPETVSDPFKNIVRISKPILIIHGLADRLANPEITDQLKHIAGPDPRVTAVKIPGADHGFRGCEKELVEAIHRWLSRINKKSK
ncbi:MAG: alpha/beta fold hydrolase [Deltaproteobacteria bacterium]|nr:alpha/beta fold hydrolase [Deltaproteobacteria bacterium]